MKKLILSVVIASLLFSSCQKNVSPAPDAKNIPGVIGAKNRATLTTDVYMAVDNELVNSQAAYMKNGVVTQLGVPGTFTHAHAIAVSGNDVYVVGYTNGAEAIFNPDNPGKPCIWKNGVLQLLPIPSGHLGGAQGVAVNGPDVYVVGYYITDDDAHSRRAMLWKNGVATMIAFNKFDSIATGIALDGTDVYVCGNAVFNGVTCGVYWKNNIWHPFAGTTVTSRTNGIAVDARHNYYISGAYSGVACYWKDANLVPIPNNKYFPGSRIGDCLFSSSIALDNNNVYVCGLAQVLVSEKYLLYLAYWKNGQQVLLPDPIGGTDTGGMLTIGVVNNQVYGSFMSDDSGIIQAYGTYNNGTFDYTFSPTYIFGGVAVIQH